MPIDSDDIEISFSFFGLSSSASLAASREAYRRYVKEFHPDIFPANSAEQKMAAEKLIEANRHKEKLEKHFELRSEDTSGSANDKLQEPQDESDWEAWEKQRRDVFEDELAEWKVRQEQNEKAKSAAREEFRHGKLVRNCRIGLILITAAMWMGWFSENAKLTEQKNANEENRRIEQNSYHPPSYIDPVSGLDVDSVWRAKVDNLRAQQGFVAPEEQLKEMPGKILLLIIWTAGAVWLLVSKRAGGLLDKFLGVESKIKTQAPWVILSVISWFLFGTGAWFLSGNANTGFLVACIGSFVVWMIGRDKAQNREMELEDPPARLFAASDFDVLAGIRDVMQNNIGDRWWVVRSFDDTPNEDGVMKAKYLMSYTETLNSNPPQMLPRQLILDVAVTKVASQASVKLNYKVASEKFRWTANEIVEATTAIIWQRLEKLDSKSNSN